MKRTHKSVTAVNKPAFKAGMMGDAAKGPTLEGMPGPQPMSTPQPPGLSGGGAPAGQPSPAPFAGRSNPDNLLPPTAFHKAGSRK